MKMLPSIVQHASPAVRETVVNLMARVERMQARAREASGPTVTMMEGGTTLVGAAGAGLVGGLVGDDNGDVQGLPVALLIALLLLGLGLGAGQPWLVRAAFGAAAGYSQSYGFALGKSLRGRSASMAA